MTSFRVQTRTAIALLLSTTLLSACTLSRRPAISYGEDVPPLGSLPAPQVEAAEPPLHTPPPWTRSRGGDPASDGAEAQIVTANAAARIEPRQAGYYNAIQFFPYSDVVLYQVYAAPGQITDIALQPGESPTGIGPIAAGATARRIIGDTTSGQGGTPAFTSWPSRRGPISKPISS